jgi:hypothetical protein
MHATEQQVSADASSAEKRAHVREFTKSLTSGLKANQLTYKHTGIKDVSHAIHMTTFSASEPVVVALCACVIALRARSIAYCMCVWLLSLQHSSVCASDHYTVQVISHAQTV